MLRLTKVIFDDNVPNWHVSRRETMGYFLILVTGGKLFYDLDGRAITLSQGEALVIRPGTIRSGSNNGYPPHQKYAVQFTIDLDPHHPLSLMINNDANELIKTQRFNYFQQRFANLYQTVRMKSSLRDVLGIAILMDIIASVFHEIELKNIPPHKLVIARKVEQYIRLHHKEGIKINDLAELVQLTPNYITSIFKEVIGQTPIEYMHHTRISTAKDLLIHSDMNITEISEYLGYCDPTYFNRMFRKVTGQPPSALVKQRET